MKKLFDKIYIVLFIALCIIPFAGLLIFGPAKPSANEVLATSPRFGMKMLDQTEDYVADRFFLRKQLATCWARINADIFRTSAEDQVILGRNGWLYYNVFGRELSDEEIQQCADRIIELSDECREKGIDFIFTIAPNKDSIHGENMPYVMQNTNAERLGKVLADSEVNYVNLFDSGIEYFATDSHWTSRGAALACNKLIGTSYKEFPVEKQHKGDLYEMLYPAGNKTETDYMVDFAHETEGNPNGGNAIEIHTTCSGREGRLKCYRDSFGIYLYPYLADNFAECTFLRSTDYSADDCDVLIIEIVERNIGDLIS